MGIRVFTGKRLRVGNRSCSVEIVVLHQFGSPQLLFLVLTYHLSPCHHGVLIAGNLVNLQASSMRRSYHFIVRSKVFVVLINL